MKLFTCIFFLLFLSACGGGGGGSSPTETESTIITQPHSLETYNSKTFDLIASSSSGASILFSIESNPSNGQIIINGSQATYNPNNNYQGVDYFTVNASDGNFSESIPISVDVFENSYKDYSMSIESTLELGTYGDPNKEIKFTVNYQGVDREFILIIPKSLNPYNKNSYPVVIHLHGNTQSAFSVYSNYSSYIKNAKDLNFYYVIPSGLSGVVGGGTDEEGTMTGWNAHFPGYNNEYDDSGFIKALINYLHDNHQITHKRIYLTGFSSGAHFAYTAANENTLIDGIQIFAGWMNKYNDWIFSQPIKAQHYHGTNDHVSYYEDSEHFGGQNSINEISSMKNCQGYDELVVDDFNGDGQKPTTIFSYSNCNDGSILQHFKIEGAEHISSTSLLYHDLSSSEQFYDFFELGSPIH